MLDISQIAKVLWVIELLEEKGTELREPYSSTLGNGLFELRIKFGSDIVRCLHFFHKEQILTQQELAERTGINRSDISKIEHGNANPSLKSMKSLAAAMGKRVRISFI